MYEFTCQMARLEPPTPQMEQLLAALPGNEQQTRRFFGVIAGTVPVQEFLSAENLQAVVAAGTEIDRPPGAPQ
jgi:hypothetical protein